MNISILLLKELDKNEELNSLEFSEKNKIDHQSIVGATKSLEAAEKVISEMKIYNKLMVTEEGSKLAKIGSYEYRIYSNVPANGIKMKDLIKDENGGNLGFGKAMSMKWIRKENVNGENLIFKNVETVKDEVSEYLQAIECGDYDKNPSKVAEYRKRLLIKEVDEKYFILKKGVNFSLSLDDNKQISVITSDLLKELGDDVENLVFKPMNLSAGGNRATNGNLHPLLKVRNEFLKIFRDMGFQEMPTNNYIESGFWNFDSLFQPQDHPARDAHDTFFVSDPAIATKFPPEYLHRVKQVHSNGGYGSQGYKVNWQKTEAQKNLLRTHTTAVSARMLYKLAQKENFEPVKYFSIDRVFRNETLDATHLAEFHQVEGLVADRGLSLGHLKLYIRNFYKEMGIHKLKFKSAYNPYTEPSMEIFGYHEGLKKWIELGNSGIFRPEMLLPMLLPEDVVVIAWGLSLERPTMIKYGINDIRDLMGPKVNLNIIYESPFCRLDK